MRDAHLIPAAQRVDVEFGAFMADDLAMADAHPRGRGHRSSPTPHARELTTYLDGNPRGKDGRVVYDLRADFGLDPADLYDRFAFYFEAFPQIRREVA